MDPKDKNVLYAGVGVSGIQPDSNGCYGDNLGGVYQSQDAGLSWTKISKELGNVRTLAISSKDLNYLYVGTRSLIDCSKLTPPDAKTYEGGLWYFNFNDPNFFRVNENEITPKAMDPYVSQIVVDPKENRHLWVATSNLPYNDSSTGNGVYEVNLASDLVTWTWKPLNTGLNMLSVWNLELDPAHRILYAGTGGGGLYRLYLQDYKPLEVFLPVIGNQ